MGQTLGFLQWSLKLVEQKVTYMKVICGEDEAGGSVQQGDDYSQKEPAGGYCKSVCSKK